MSVCQAQGRRAAILRTGFPGEDGALVSKLTKKMQSSGYILTEIGIADICDAQRLNRSKYDLLVLPDASMLPELSQPVIDAFLAGGGDIIALNAPLWQKPVVKVDGRWITRKEHRQMNAGVIPEHLLFGFGSKGIADWAPFCDDPAHMPSFETIAKGPVAGHGSLQMTINHQRGTAWITSPVVPDAFRTGDTLTIFSAKGDANASHLRIDWMEKDGSRWTSRVLLSTKWERYAIKPEQFRYAWGGTGRGGAGDRFKPENAAQVALCVAYDICDYAVGKHQIWIGPFGTEKAQAGDLPDEPAVPVLDTLSPAYKFFDSTGVTSIAIRSDQALLEPLRVALPSGVRSSSPRPQAGGFDKGRPWRWIPLMQAKTSKSEWRGNPATLLVHADGKYKGGIWASFSIPDMNWYKIPAAMDTIGKIAERMNNRVFIIDGGSGFYTYFDGQDVRLGIRAINLDDGNREGLIARVRVTDPKTGKRLTETEWPLKLVSGEIESLNSVWSSREWPSNGLLATAEILDNGKVIDRVSNEVSIWKPKKVQKRVTVQNGEFMLNGKRWRANGINYLAGSGIAMEDGAYTENWLGAPGYDPESVDRDLRIIRGMGFNTVSVFVNPPHVKAQNLLDFLRRLDRYGLKAHMALRPGIYFPPGEPYWPQMKETIEFYRLWEHDTILMYDVAWEPFMGYHHDRAPWDGEWEKWVVERYGSIENAERDWGYPIPRDEKGNVTNPYPSHFIDGEWRRMVAAYRRFCDLVLYRKYSHVRNLIREIDPNALVSFRMAEAGNPTFLWHEAMPYDFPYLAIGVDVVSPEAYGRMGDWEVVKPGRFTYEYSRLSDPSKPMIWAEGGFSTWDNASMTQPKARLEFQAKFYEAFYRMLTTSGADGVLYWWYAGGFRFGENSDFGVINPDGSDRPSTKVIRRRSQSFINGPAAKPVDKWIDIDRDKHPIGFGGVYREVKDEFWKAVDAGLTPGLRTGGTGTTSANCPLIAIGGTECNGNNPPKHLDSVFDSLKVLDANGRWVPVAKDAEVSVKKGTPVRIRVTLTNLGEAKWLASGGIGSVHLIAEGGELSISMTADVPHAGSITLESVVADGIAGDRASRITLVLEAQGRVRFGEKYTIVLMPK